MGFPALALGDAKDVVLDLLNGVLIAFGREFFAEGPRALVFYHQPVIDSIGPAPGDMVLLADIERNLELGSSFIQQLANLAAEIRFRRLRAGNALEPLGKAPGQSRCHILRIFCHAILLLLSRINNSGLKVDLLANFLSFQAYLSEFSGNIKGFSANGARFKEVHGFIGERAKCFECSGMKG